MNHLNSHNFDKCISRIYSISADDYPINSRDTRFTFKTRQARLEHAGCKVSCTDGMRVEVIRVAERPQ